MANDFAALSEEFRPRAIETEDGWYLIRSRKLCREMSSPGLEMRPGSAFGPQPTYFDLKRKYALRERRCPVCERGLTEDGNGAGLVCPDGCYKAPVLVYEISMPMLSSARMVGAAGMVDAACEEVASFVSEAGEGAELVIKIRYMDRDEFEALGDFKGW